MYIDSKTIVEYLKKNAELIANMNSENPIIEKGSDGSCLFYSLMHSETQEFLKEKFNIKHHNYVEMSQSIPSQHKANAQKLREFIGKTLFKSYTEYDNYTKNKNIENEKLTDTFISLYPLLLSSASKDLRIQGFNGELVSTNSKLHIKTITENALNAYLDPTFYAGEKTIAAYSMLTKRHVIVFNLAYDTQNGSKHDGQVIINRLMKPYDSETIKNHMLKKVKDINLKSTVEPFKNDKNGVPNYIILVRHGGHHSHFQPLRRNNNDKMITLDDKIISMLNDQKLRDRYSYEEFFKPPYIGPLITNANTNTLTTPSTNTKFSLANNMQTPTNSDNNTQPTPSSGNETKSTELFIKHMSTFSEQFVKNVGEMYSKYNDDLESIGKNRIHGEKFIESVNDIIRCMVQKLPK
jgi:hypothetical protein